MRRVRVDDTDHSIGCAGSFGGTVEEHGLIGCECIQPLKGLFCGLCQRYVQVTGLRLEKLATHIFDRRVNIILAAIPHPRLVFVVELPRETWMFEFSSCNRVTRRIKAET